MWYRSIAVIGIRLDGDRVAEKSSLNEDTEASVASYKNSKKGLSEVTVKNLQILVMEQ